MFERLIHADWSTDDRKKWMAFAEPTGQGWRIFGPQRVPPADEFIEQWLFEGRSVLAGFDFPIGVPATFGEKTGFSGFVEALPAFGVGEWSRFFEVAERPEDVSLKRPFYPHRTEKGCRHDQLLRGLGFETMNELRRTCERKTENRRAACSVFWTLGGNQVGKAAIDGWHSVIRPAVLRGASLWPFAGRLDALSRSAGCVLCETYPQEAYGHVGVRFGGRSKRSQQDRRVAGAQMLSWAERRHVQISADTKKQVDDGFGPSKSGEDPFDAVAGLLSMIAVVSGERDEGAAVDDGVVAWEGWILGQRPQNRSQ